LDHVFHPGLAQILSGTDRAEVVEGEGLGDIIDDSLHGDNLCLLVKLDDFSREDIPNPRVKPNQVASLKFGKHFGLQSVLQQYERCVMSLLTWWLHRSGVVPLPR
jgi:hypothetical protein